MSLRGDCPVCGKWPINPTFKEFVISVSLRDQPQHPIGGLRAYQCEQEQHIFFVMRKDIELPDIPSSESVKYNRSAPHASP